MKAGNEAKRNCVDFGFFLFSGAPLKGFKGIKNNYFVLLCEFGVEIQKHFQIK